MQRGVRQIPFFIASSCPSPMEKEAWKGNLSYTHADLSSLTVYNPNGSIAGIYLKTNS